jgi:hypothetical protein
MTIPRRAPPLLLLLVLLALTCTSCITIDRRQVFQPAPAAEAPTIFPSVHPTEGMTCWPRKSLHDDCTWRL